MTENKKILDKYQVVYFTLVAYLISWSFWSISNFLDVSELSFNVLFILGGFGPFLSAIIMIRIIKGKNEIKPWLKNIFKIRVGGKWYLLALLLPLLLLLLSIIIMRFIGRYELDFSMIAPLSAYPILFLYVFFIGGGQEEPGWRGFALPLLLKNYSPLLASLIIGIIWVFWHSPLFFIKDTVQQQIPFFWYLINTLALSIIFTFLYLKTNGVLPAMILHAGLNAGSAYIPFTQGINAFFPYLVIVSCIIALVMIVIYKKPQRFIFEKVNIEKL